MAIPIWDEKLSTGIEEIDSQHKELIKRIDSLEKSVYGGNSKTEVKKMMEFLGSYVMEHFDAEEKLMTEADYPDISKHREEHKKFKSLYSDLVIEYDKRGGDYYFALDIHRRLIDWFTKHLLEIDAAYVPYLKKNPEGPGSKR